MIEELQHVDTAGTEWRQNRGHPGRYCAPTRQARRHSSGLLDDQRGVGSTLPLSWRLMGDEVRLGLSTRQQLESQTDRILPGGTSPTAQPHCGSGRRFGMPGLMTRASTSTSRCSTVRPGAPRPRRPVARALVVDPSGAVDPGRQGRARTVAGKERASPQQRRRTKPLRSQDRFIHSPQLQAWRGRSSQDGGQ